LRTGALAGVLSIATLALPAHAQSPDPTKTGAPTQGVSSGATYDGETFSELSGGAKRGSTYHGSLQLYAAFDAARLLGWTDTTGFLYGTWLHGGQPDDFAGAAQGVSSIAGPRGARLQEAWLQRNFLGDRLSLLGGRYDANSEFYRLHSAALFLNSSFGAGPEFSQSGVAGPSVFPSTSLAARAQFKATPELLFRAVIANGVPYNRPAEADAPTRSGNGVLLISEAAYLERPGDAEPRNRRLRTGRFSGLAPYDSKYAVGLWRYTGSFEDLSATGAGGEPVLHRGSGGGYVLVDRLLMRSPGGARVAGFLQLGLGDARVNRFGSYVGAGLAASGIVPGRPGDEIGIALASARNGSHYVERQEQLGTPVRRTESTLEITYLAQISKSVAVQPDLQYVRNPNTDPALKNALALLLRFEVSF
jgi:porin